MSWNLITIGAAAAWLSFAVSLLVLLVKANGSQPRQIHRIRFFFMILFALTGIERLAAIDMQDALGRLIGVVLRESPAWLPSADRGKFALWQALRRAGNVWAVVMIPVFISYVLWEIDVWRRARLKAQFEKENPW